MEHMNWAAFAVAVVLQIIVGYIWFHPSVMGKAWAKANNTDIESMKPANPALTYGLTILLTIFFTFWLTINVTGPGQDTAPDGHSYHTFQHGIGHALFITILIMIPVFGTLSLFQKKSRNWFLIQVGYWFFRMAFAFGILSLWR